MSDHDAEHFSVVLRLSGDCCILSIAEVIYAKGLSKKAGARGDKPEKEKNFISMVALHTLFFCGITAEFFGK